MPFVAIAADIEDIEDIAGGNRKPDWGPVVPEHGVSQYRPLQQPADFGDRVRRFRDRCRAATGP